MTETPTPTSAHDIVTPGAAALMEAMRSLGYSTATAIADLIDNSISAGARTIHLDFQWNGEDSRVLLLDDGAGMTAAELVEAMRPGTRNPRDERATGDLGRFGLGLKTASFSQCRRLTVGSRPVGGELSVRCWNLDHVNATGEWQLLRHAPASAEALLQRLSDQPHGTLVIWEQLDRIVHGGAAGDRRAHERFRDLVDAVRHHLAMVFGRFLTGRDRVRILINGNAVRAWDPFLSDHPATQTMPAETLMFRHQRVQIRGYVLPHHSLLGGDELEAAAGPGGWNDQQGFYVYRNNRLLVAGAWLGLGLRREEQFRLARIAIDLPNTLDADWDIDVRKSRARPPGPLRDQLQTYATAVRRRALEVYRHRGRIAERTAGGDPISLWGTHVNRGHHRYVIQRDHPLVTAVTQALGASSPGLHALLRLIEETVPVERIWVDAAEQPDAHGLPFEDAPDQEVLGVLQSMLTALQASGYSAAEARRRIATMEPFSRQPGLLGHLDRADQEGDRP